MANLTGFVEGTDGKGDDLSRHGGDLRFCPDFQSYRRCGDVFDIQRDATVVWPSSSPSATASQAAPSISATMQGVA